MSSINNIIEQIAMQELSADFTTMVLAFSAGIITSLSPCCLSTVSMLVILVSGCEEPTAKRSFCFSLIFALGATLTFTALGIAGASIGKLFFISDGMIYLLLGIVIILMSLQSMGLYTFVPSSAILERHFFQGYAGAFAGGLCSGFFSAPCCTPILIAILSMIASEGNLGDGILIMLAYALGHNMISVIAGTSFSFAQSMIHNHSFKFLSEFLKYAMSVLMLVMGLVLIYKGL